MTSSGSLALEMRSNLDCSFERSFSTDHEEDFDEQKKEEEEELPRRLAWWAKEKIGSEEEEERELLLNVIERCISPLVLSIVEEEEDSMSELDLILVLIQWSSLALFVHSQLDETFPQQTKHFEEEEEEGKEYFFQLTFQKEKTKMPR